MILLGLTVVLRGQASSGVRIVRVGVLTDNYPFSSRAPDGRIVGFAYDLTEEIERTMGLKFQRIEGTTSEIHQAFRAGRIDLLQSYAQFPEREGQADFSVPYLTMAGAIFVRTDETRIASLSDLRGRKVLVHAGSLGETVLRKAGLADEIVYAESIERAVQRLSHGEGDATLVTRLSGQAQAHRFGLKNLRPLPAKVPGYDVRYCFAVQDGDRELLARLNEGLAVLVRTGRFDEIYQKWFGHMEPVGYTAEQVIGAVAVALALALAIALWAAFQQRNLRKRIAQQTEALRLSEERHRGVFEGALDGLLVLTGSPEGPLVEQANPAARRLLSDRLGPGARLESALADDAPLAAGLRAALAAARTKTWEHRRPDQSLVRVMVSPLGERTLVSLTDITEQWQARERIRQQEEQLRQKQKLEAVGTLAGGVAHDFNNLLTAIIGNTELALMGLPKDHPEVSGLQQVMRAARRARDLVKQILAFSRQAAPSREVVALTPLVEETINLLRTLARGAVDFQPQLPAGLPAIWADPAQVHQVLMNIGTNAVQAMRGTAGRLVFTAEPVEVGEEMPQPGLRPGHYIRVGIQDNGPGMPPEVQQRAFEPFFTTKATGEGTGLGLSVVHGIMQQHGGMVTLYSQAGRGTLFHLYFPAAPAETARLGDQRPEAVPAGRGERVLFVDDDASIVETVRKMLTRLGYRVNAHAGADAAWADFVAHPGSCDLILSDLTMPGMNGLQLLGRVRALRADQPFVLCSGFFMESERAEAVSLGATALLMKPLTYETLGRAVAAALGRSHGQQSPGAL